MGLDARMAVTLKSDTDFKALEKRFMETFRPEDVMVNPGTTLFIETSDYEEFPENTWNVSCGYCRYYGIGYQRGPLMRILTQLEWFRCQPEVLQVYYGHDCAETIYKWSRENSMELLEHFWIKGETGYRGPVSPSVWNLLPDV